MDHWTLRHLHWLLMAGIAVLGLLNIIDLSMQRPFWAITETIRLDQENNIPSWFSSVLLCVAGVMSFRCYRVSTERNITPARGFLLTAVILFSLSCDEVASLHERFGRLMARTWMPVTSATAEHTDWVIILGPLAVLVAGILGYVLYRHLHGSRQALVTILGGLVMLIAMGVVLEGLTNLLDKQEQQFLWNLEVFFEEIGEMIGAWLISFGLMIHADRLLEMPSENETLKVSHSE